MVIDWEVETRRALREQNDPESHTETEPCVWHPSQLGYCDRQAYLSKLGLKKHDAGTLGSFKTGTLIHEWFEETVNPNGHTEFEMPITLSPGDSPVEIVGRCDVYHVGDNYDWVYDFKSRHGWYNFEPPTDRHVDQLQVYMAAVGADFGQVVYVSKKDLEVRRWPEGREGIRASPSVVRGLVEKAERLGQPIEDQGLPRGPEEIPFEPCGCWICDNETLDPEAFY